MLKTYKVKVFKMYWMKAFTVIVRLVMNLVNMVMKKGRVA